MSLALMPPSSTLHHKPLPPHPLPSSNLTYSHSAQTSFGHLDTLSRTERPRSQPIPVVTMPEDSPVTPSPRPKRRRNKHSRSRHVDQDGDVEDQDELFDILGVAPSPKLASREEQPERCPGIIVLPKKEQKKVPKKRAKRSKSMLAETGTLSMDAKPRDTIRDGKGVFETTSLSQSLPMDVDGVMASRKAAKGKKAEKDETVWAMPDVSGGEELTWQQKLAQHETPTRPARKPQSERKPKSKLSTLWTPHPGLSFADHTGSAALRSFAQTAPRPGHVRGVSHDSPSKPVSLATFHTGKPALPISAFDGQLPFHTGYNAHRIPQTPAKSVASMHGNLLQGDHALPIIPGEFPRIRDAAGAGPAGGNAAGEFKYAGPTFHNSPHAGTLSKPDLDDF
ncbi:hypothetical protein L204_101341 [Cryptococcus depauperatus]